MTSTAAPIRVDAEFASICPPLKAKELAGLVKSVTERGVREPLVVWEEEGILLDGHHRKGICDELRRDPPITLYSFPDREAARAWVVDNQLGRRNLSPDQASYLRGKRYAARKAGHGGHREASGQIDHLSTAEAVAEESGVSEKTIRRDASFAQGVDKIAETAGPEARAAILSGDLKIPRQDIAAVAAAAPEDVDRARQEAQNARAVRAADAQARWSKGLYKIQVHLNSVRDLGGIEGLTASWDDELRKSYAADLREASDTMAKWADTLEGAE